MVTILKWFFDIRKKKTVQSFFLRKVEKIFDALSYYQHHYKKNNNTDMLITIKTVFHTTSIYTNI